MAKPTKTQAEKRYHDKVSKMECICCELMDQKQTTRTEVHHVRTGQGMSQRAGHYCVLPLCVECHRGHYGIHGDKSFLNILKVNEMELLNLVVGRMIK